MAARRSRIKGIANIPPRKRLTDPSKTDNFCDIENNPSIQEESQELHQTIINKSTDEGNTSIPNIGIETDKVLENTSEITSEFDKQDTINEEQKNDDCPSNSEKENILTESLSNDSLIETKVDTNEAPTTSNNQVKPGLLRRKFLKPSISANAIKRLKTTNTESQNSDELSDIQKNNTVDKQGETNDGNQNTGIVQDETKDIAYNDQAKEESKVKVPRRKCIRPTVSVGVLGKKSQLKIDGKQNLVDETTSQTCLNEPSTVQNLTELTANSGITRDVRVDEFCNDEEPLTNTTREILQSNSSKDPENSNFTCEDASERLENDDVSKKTPTPKEPAIFRRKFVKPSISISALNRKMKLAMESKNDSVQKHIDDSKSEKSVKQFDEPLDENSVTDTTNGNISSCVETDRIDYREENQTTLDEIHLTPRRVACLAEDNNLKKPITIITSTQSDIDYPPPLPSPSKINRSRIKAVPRLNYRKASFSASESEDEVRRVGNRIRNDSICSTTSGMAESITESISPQKSREINSIIQKKCNRTEQTRKLVEARKEFQKRFGSNKPDRQQLTMMDLIFYNPESNPIISSEPTDTKAKSEKPEEEVESEKVDDPVKEDSEKSEEETDIPGPQVKIGPSGEIILDEKSLVIERKELKRKQEELQKSQVVDGDFDRGYGIYKKHKRSKKWSSSETLRFYKALNTIGTDFTLMREFFPNRTRREIKMKFKKEEKINQMLIDRALLQPCNFDYDELQNEIDTEQKENEELERQRLEKIKLKEKRKLENPKKRKFSVVETLEPVEKVCKLYKRKKIKRSNKLKVNESDADESDLQTQSESEDELILQHPPTRSGRLPKVPEKFQSEESLPITASTINVTRKPAKVIPVKEEREESIVKHEPVQIEPGSIMIMCEKGNGGEPVYKIFMVTPQQSATPVNLAPDAIARAIQFKKGMTAENIVTISANNTDDEEEDDVIPEENNYTIPADENVTTLRSNPPTDDDTDASRCSFSENNSIVIENESQSIELESENETTEIFQSNPDSTIEREEGNFVEVNDEVISDIAVQPIFVENNPDMFASDDACTTAIDETKHTS